MQNFTFKKAVPVWESGKEDETNYNLAFRTIVPRGGATIAVAASNMYQMFVGGKMIAEGPARAGHGYYRVDEIDLGKYLTEDENIVAIYVNGYNIYNFDRIKQSAFLCAEVIKDGEIIAATGVSLPRGFEAKYHSDRLRKIVRFSYQRAFAECYTYDENYKDFECKTDAEFCAVTLVRTGEKNFITREVPYPCYDEIGAEKIICRGSVKFHDEPIDPVQNRYIDLPEKLAHFGYAKSELEMINTDEADKGEYTPEITAETAAEPLTLEPDSYAIYALPSEKTGFITLEVCAEEKCELIVVFDELLTDGDVSTKRFSIQNAVIWNLAPGKYSLITNEPCSMKYIKVINKSDGKLGVKKVALTEFAFDTARFSLPEMKELGSTNDNLNRIYDAAAETFRQNTVDIYSDCPTRERAGWLCDSFFTSRVEHFLTGKSVVEKNFLENFIYKIGFDDIDSRMLPMCYPSDFVNDSFIPNWAMWYCIEAEEYLARTGDRDFIDTAKPQLEALAQYFEEYENSDGLLEKLSGWVFIEWSKANDYIQDVNYPSNMLYARMLMTLGRLYGGDYGAKAERIIAKVREQSFNGTFFRDHAVRNADGTLTICDDITETCQYYAFFSGTATKDEYPELWQTMLHEFGPDRQETGLWAEIAPSAPFIGNYLRLELLANDGTDIAIQKLLADIEGYFGYMADKTGTLWETQHTTASCNHGFASHVLIWLKKFAPKA